MYDAGTRLSTEVGQDVEKFFSNGRERPTPWAEARLFQSRVRRNIRLAEAPGFGQSIFQYAADSHGAEELPPAGRRSVAREKRPRALQTIRGRLPRYPAHSVCRFCPAAHGSVPDTIPVGWHALSRKAKGVVRRGTATPFAFRLRTCHPSRLVRPCSPRR